MALRRHDIDGACSAPELVRKLEEDPLIHAARLARALPQGELAHEEVDGLSDVSDCRPSTLTLP